MKTKDKQMENKESYRVEIVSFKEDKVLAIIGKNMNLKKAQEREDTSLHRIDLNNFYVRIVNELTGEVF